MGRVVHVSGHVDIDEIEFLEHYIPELEESFFSGDSFVVGDCAGVDSMAQKFLFGLGGADVTVYCVGDEPKVNVGDWPVIGGFTTPNECDAAMTEASDYDIAWVRKGKEKSHTAKNLRRRWK